MNPRKRSKPITSADAALRVPPRERAPHKRAIARYASNLVAPGETVAVNAGSTTAFMSDFLIYKQVSIITNSFRMASTLLRFSDNDVELTAGTVYREHDVVISPFDDGFRTRSAAKLFTGVFAIGPHGLTEADPVRIQAAQQLARLAQDIYVLADSDKLGRTADLILCRLNRVSTIITDTGAADLEVQMLERAGVRVVTVEPELPGTVYH